MKRKFDVITIGGAVRDVLFFTDKGKIFKTPEDLTSQRMWGFEYGAKIKINRATCSMGGGAFNCAYNLKKLGYMVAPIVRLGRDPDGEWIKKYMLEHGIDTHYVQFDNSLATGFSFILTTSKKECDHIAFLFRGANEDLDITHDILSSIETKWYYITSLGGENWLKNLKNIFNYAKEKGIKIAWNPGGTQLEAGKGVLEKFLKQTDILLLNKDEAIELVLSGITLGKRDPHFLNKPVYLLNILNDWGVKIIVVTLGEKGVTAYKDGKIYFQKAIRKKVLDTTGVGDAFGAAFLGGLLRYSNDIKIALLWGVINSANVLTEIGAHNGILTQKELINEVRRYLLKAK